MSAGVGSGVAFAVHDPSNRQKGSYWQWSSHGINKTWDTVAATVHSGWPTVRGAVESDAEELFGVIDTPTEGHWLYRIYSAGRDSHGRPGRYFAVICQLAEPGKCLEPSVSGVLNYFVRERRLPLDCDPLRQGIPWDEPSAVLRRIYAEWEKRVNGAHWGMDGSGAIRRFAALPREASIRSGPIESVDNGSTATPLAGLHWRFIGTASRWFRLAACLVISHACFGVLVYRIGYNHGVDAKSRISAAEAEADSTDRGDPKADEAAASRQTAGTEKSEVEMRSVPFEGR
jgi:hypothetical protein